MIDTTQKIKLNNSLDSYEAWMREDSMKTTIAAVRNHESTKVAECACLTGKAAYYFAAGYAGARIKDYNPRQEGFESEFRAGVEAWSKDEHTRICAIAKEMEA